LVRNIGPQITNNDLGLAFGRIGDVRDVYIPRDYHSQQAKGFAFIEYADPEQAREARDEMDRFRIKGCELEVVFAQERRKSPNEMRGRVVNQQNHGGGDGRGGGGGRSNRDRSSSFERHQRRRRDNNNNGSNGNKERNGNDEKKVDPASSSNNNGGDKKPSQGGRDNDRSSDGKDREE